MRSRPSVFLDTSVVVGGIWSAGGGARAILELAEAGAVDVILGAEVLAELEAVMRRKIPDKLGLLAALLDRVGVRVAAKPSADLVGQAAALAGHRGDGGVLAAAWAAGVDFFVTLDRAHFLDRPALRAATPFPLGTPGDFLAWYRARVQP